MLVFHKMQKGEKNGLIALVMLLMLTKMHEFAVTTLQKMIILTVVHLYEVED